MDVLLPFAVILVAFYFLILRPQRSRARAAEQLQSRLVPGAEIMTTSGLFGTVSGFEDDKVLLEISPGVTIKIVKAAVGRIVSEDGAAATSADEVKEPDSTADTDHLDDSDNPDAGRRDTPGD